MKGVTKVGDLLQKHPLIKQLVTMRKKKEKRQTRVIEFRGKDVHSGEWVYGLPTHYWTSLMADKWAIREDTGKTHEVFQETIGEYTGLEDSKHNAIYEGDIVEHDGITYKVYFQGGIFYAADVIDARPKVIKRLSTLCKSKRPCYLRGNIYEKQEEEIL